MEKHPDNVNEKGEPDGETKMLEKGPFFGKRHIQASLLFLSVTIELMSRFTLTLSIGAMTDNTTSVNPDVPTYNWSDKNVILSSFYWGYVIPQVLVGQLGKTYGAKWVLFYAMGFNSIALAFVPFAAKYAGSKGVMACRILQGLAQGGLLPSYHTMMGRWGPNDERGLLSNFIYSGISIGPMICLPITGIISKSYLGWPTTCYLFGGCGLVWCLLWFYLGYNSPAVHPSISPEEKKYIEESLHQTDQKVIPTPWKEIFFSLPCWACVISSVGSGFGIIFIQNEMPTYLEKVMNYDVTASGYLSSMTAVVALASGYIYGPLADFIVKRNYISQTNCRKIFAMYSSWGSAATMLGLAYIDESQAHLSILLLALSSLFTSAVIFGPGINPMDLSPRFSGIILGWANSVTCLVALTGPLAVQWLVHDEYNASQWRIVFLVAAGMYIGCSTIFSLFGSAQRQWWDDGIDNKEEHKTDSKDLQQHNHKFNENV